MQAKNIKSTITLELSVEDATALLQKAAARLLRDDYGMSVSPDDINVRFNTTLRYHDYFERDAGSPEVSGVSITVNSDVTSKTPKVGRVSRSSLASQIESVENDKDFGPYR